MVAEVTMSQFSQELIITLIVTIIVPFVVQWLRNRSAEAKARAALANVERQKALADRVISYLYGTAANLAEKRFPIIARQVIEGKLKTPDAVKAELKNWGTDLKLMAKAHFDTQGVDLFKEFADETLDNWIERAANQASPFPGMETAKVLLKDNVSNVIVDRGIEYAKIHVMLYEDGGLVPVAQK